MKLIRYIFSLTQGVLEEQQKKRHYLHHLLQKVLVMVLLQFLRGLL